jgi:hypothetical protein
MICIIQNTGTLLLVAKNKLVLSVFVLFQTYIAEGQWFSPGIPVSSTNKTDHHDIK